LQIIMTAANAVPVERRGVFLERVGAMGKLREGASPNPDVHDETALGLSRRAAARGCGHGADTQIRQSRRLALH
jgi:hypothetical protein